MKSFWNDKEAKKVGKDPLALRVYTSRLLGKSEDLVLHGGGNTSVKVTEKDIFGNEVEVLYVKGSGWNLATIEAQGFAPVKLKTLEALAELADLSDIDMVKNQRMALMDPSAPNPSVEAILHGIIPYKFVDHTHADAVVTITNTPDGRKRIEEIYGDRILIVPYVMPGFILAREIYKMTKGIDWSTIDGMILMNHGVFTFHDDPKQSYENMIAIVTTAEDYLKDNIDQDLKSEKAEMPEPIHLAKIRKKTADIWGKAVLSKLNTDPKAVAFSKLKSLKKITSRGPLTPDHIIRTKRTPVVLGKTWEKAMEKYEADYREYFKSNQNGHQTMLDPTPRWAILPGAGTLSFGPSVKSLKIIEDISSHTMKSIYQAEALKKWKALPEKELFEMEYWSLEQAKLKKAKSAKAYQGKIALVTGAASGIGKACVESLVKEGAVLAALDIDPKIKTMFETNEVLGIKCDVTRKSDLKKAIAKTVYHFGGIDMLVSNAGIFPPSHEIAEMDEVLWTKSMNVNLNSHMMLIKMLIPYLEIGLDPSVVIIGSKNVAAPGPGAGAYSVAKAGLAQLGRIAALELGKKGIRVNTLHPNAVFDTGIWSDDVLAARAENYGISVEEYKKNNILKTVINSADVAGLAVAMLGTTFSKVTGAQIPIDGGNNRVI